MGKLIDLTGQKFNRLTVIRRAENSRSGDTMWLCKCECGNETIVNTQNLKHGQVKSCGCLLKDICEQSIEDLTGKRFGHWTVIKRVKSPEYKYVSWLCKCDCGTEKVIAGKELRRGRTKSCGCMNKAEDMTGKRFGSLTVVKRVENSVRNKAQYLCRCDCGKEVVVLATLLRRGAIKSCGSNGCRGKYGNLLNKQFGDWTVIEYRNNGYWRCRCVCGNESNVSASDLISGRSKGCGCAPKLIHGCSGSRLYIVWEGIKQRCYNEKSPNYKGYGGRGITVCDEWLNDFQAFYDWAYANGYDDNAEHGECTIDRIDVNGNYEPSNCRWATARQQANNTRRNRYITYNGETLTVAEWARKTGINVGTLYNRLARGMDIEKALT